MTMMLAKANSVGASCSQAGAGIYQCFPDWVKDNPRAKYEFAKCVWDNAGWYELLYDGRVQACSLWLSTFDISVLSQGVEEGWTGTAAERERIRDNLVESVDRETTAAEVALGEAERTGDAQMEADALARLEELAHLRDVALEEYPADYFYFEGAEAGETAADAVETVKELGGQAKDAVLGAGKKLLWWSVGIAAGLGTIWAIAYGMTANKAKRGGSK